MEQNKDDKYIQCMKKVEQWHERLLKLQDLELTHKADKQKEIRSLTNIRVGPPSNLNEREKNMWVHNLLKALANCVEDILIPYHKSILKQKWVILKDKIGELQGEQVLLPNLGWYLTKGINRSSYNGKIKAESTYKFKSFPPPPPPLQIFTPHKENLTISGDTTIMEQYATTEKIGNLKRGELFTPLKNGFVLNERLKATEDITKILAFGIFGSRDKKSFIYRSLFKYMLWYEKREKSKFQPQFVIDRKLGEKKVNTWKKYLIDLRRQSNYLSEKEVQLVSLLYQVEIRIFSRISYTCNNVNNVNNFMCVKQFSQMNNRVLNILHNPDGTWSYLEGIIWPQQHCNQVNVMLINDKVIGDSNVELNNKIQMNGIIDNTDREGVEKVGWEESWREGIFKDRELRFKQSIDNIDNQGIQNRIIEVFSQITASIRDSPVTRKQNTISEDYLQKVVEETIENSTNSNELDPYLITEENREELDVNTILKQHKDTQVTQRRIVEEFSQITPSIKDRVPIEGQINLDSEHIRREAIDSAVYLESSLENSINSDSSDLLSISELNREVLDNLEARNTPQRSNPEIGEGNSIRTSSTIARLFPDELISDNTETRSNNSINRRKVWQKWRNAIRNYNKLRKKKEALRKEKEEIAQRNRLLVFDYSTTKLDQAEIEILSKGETFCPITSEIDVDRLKTDIYNYNRRLRLHEQYKDSIPLDREESNGLGSNRRLTSDNQNQSTRNSILGQRMSTIGINQQSTKKEIRVRRQPSTYDPLTQNRNLIRYTNCIQEDCLLVIQDRIRLTDNITRQQRIALNTLKRKIKDKTIIITKADKGSGIVVLDYDLYIKKGTHYIEEEVDAYELVSETEKDIVAKLIKQRNTITDKLRKEGVIPLQTATYCTRQLEEKVTGVKFLYKIHKEEDIQKTPLRPVQSCISAPTHHLSIVLTDILQPLLNIDNIPTYIFDSNHLLFRLQSMNNIPESCTLISSDVSALYPSIPHAQGLRAANSFLQEKTTFSNSQIHIIIKALELVITQNFMMWNDKIYRQKGGVAMGTPVAVAYANIFMHWVDIEIKRRTGYVFEHIRFIDDNLFILPEDKIEDLMLVANNILPPHIKFTYDKLHKNSDKGLPFLDTQLYISTDNKIESRLYTKKTDRHAYLLPSSYHPPHVTSNIPKAVFKRLRRICSKEEWFEEDIEKAKDWLKERNYKERDIQKAMEEAKRKDRWEMITKIELKRDKNLQQTELVQNIPFIVTYNQHANSLKKALNKRQELLDSCFRRTKVKPRLSFRRQKNLGDILIQKSLRGPIRSIDLDKIRFTPCTDIFNYRTRCPCKGVHNQQRCRCCMHARYELKDIETKIWKQVDCNSKNIIYIIGCKLCDKQYVGETQQALRDRLLQHMNNINKLNQPLYLHFRLTHKPENMYISVLETVGSEEQMYRKVREAWWINHLQTLEPRGFNAKLECNQIYREVLLDSTIR